MARRQGKRPVRGALEFFARCAGGFEEVLGQELRALGMARVRPQVGGVIFFGSQADGYRACLWSRVATRVQLVLGRVAATDAEVLYQGVRALAWEGHVPDGATIAVDAHGENPQLRNTQFTALKVKDALCDRLRDVRGVRPDVDAKDPDVAINVAVHPQKATVYLNLSGASLHRRGYRQEGMQSEAPLKETLAAGILLAAGWPARADAGGCLVDPMCGSGTFAIEAALMAAHVAPGLLRMRWGFEGWAQHDPALWESLRAEAELERLWETGAPRILAGDIDERALALARANARRAGIADLVRLYADDAVNLARHLRALRDAFQREGLLVTNPPYGMRLLAQEDLGAVNEALASAVDAVPRGWELALVTPDTGVDTALGRLPQEVLACHNGPIPVWVRRYSLAGAPCEQQVVSLGGVRWTVRIAEPHSAQFAARLRKVAKERARWAAREGIACYRVYDADLPDYALAVDLYQGAGQDGDACWLVLSERRRPASVDALRAARRLADAAALAAATLDVPASQVVVHAWRSRREEAWAPEQPAHRYLTVAEGTCRFELDLARPDVSLFLAQRAVRALAAAQVAPGARVAGLFSTSGVALVRALEAGAGQAVAVDASEAWLEGVRRMAAASGSAGARLRLASADVRSWLAREARGHRLYDLLICLAPSWLPAADAGGAPWDMARDGQALLEAAGRLLARGGALLLAWDGAGFEPDLQALARGGLQVEDASAHVVPDDFARARLGLRCLVMRRG